MLQRNTSVNNCWLEVTIPGETRYTYWNGDYFHAGGRGEAGIGRRFTSGGEVGALISTSQISGQNVVVVYVGPGCHFTSRSGRKLAAFVTGVASLRVAACGGESRRALLWRRCQLLVPPPEWTEDGVPRSREGSGRSGPRQAVRASSAHPSRRYQVPGQAAAGEWADESPPWFSCRPSRRDDWPRTPIPTECYTRVLRERSTIHPVAQSWARISPRPFDNEGGQGGSRFDFLEALSRRI